MKEELNDVLAEQTGACHIAPSLETTAKKSFVEPEISVPVDVLEATTFFQGLTSGATN